MLQGFNITAHKEKQIIIQFFWHFCKITEQHCIEQSPCIKWSVFKVLKLLPLVTSSKWSLSV